MTTTPPLQSRLRTPPAPLHGAIYDKWEPYVTRKSTRSTTQRAARTPSPDSSLPPKRKPSSSSAAHSATHTYSPPSSTQNSPQKRSRKDIIDKPHASNGILSVDPAMLPTPAKTPRKKITQPVANSSARVLFPSRPEDVDDKVPKATRSGRRGKKHTGFSLGGLGYEDDAGSDTKIEIYTDIKDRIPEVDDSPENPFYVKPGTESKRANKRRRVNNGTDHIEEVQELLKHGEGMVYVHRGKKVYHRFADSPDDYELRHGPVTRSAIVPRRLFPSKTHTQTNDLEVDNTDDEAATDIEDPHAHDRELTEVASKIEDEHLVTPVKTSFTPNSPPSTGRATRASTRKAALDSSPLRPEPIDLTPNTTLKKATAFDKWPRTKGSKPSTGTGKGRKRELETPEYDTAESKKVKVSSV